MRRGFLPRGLLDTCPPFGEDRGVGASPGQVSNKPKRTLPYANVNYAAAKANGEFQSSNRECRAEKL